MTISISLKKFTAAAVVAAPLTLVACGSNGEEADQEGTETSTITSEATTAPAGEPGDEADGEGEGDAAAGAEGEGDNEGSATPAAGANSEGGSGGSGGSAGAVRAAGAAGAAGAGGGGGGGGGGGYNPLESGDISVVPQQPVQGAAANNEVAGEIRGLVENSYDQTSLHDFISYIPDNTCQRVIDANGGPQAFKLDGLPNMKMSDMPGWEELHVSDVSDITVDGRDASASVTVQTAEGRDTQTQRFLHEGGQWKFCDSQ